MAATAEGECAMNRLGSVFAGYVRATSHFSITEDDLWIWIVATLACAAGIAAAYALEAIV
jgi:hypothetical protein